jgi:hypothetical protein
MNATNKGDNQGVNGPLAASSLMAQLRHVCKRKRAFGGQVVDMQRRLIEQKRQERRGR